MKRVLYFDTLNIFACICVIALHCNGIVHSYSDTIAWKQSLAIEIAAYWAVPVFFMLTGATLFEYRSRYSTKEFFLKRIKNTLIPFLGWSLFYLIYRIVTKEFLFTSVSEVISGIINYKFQTRYWFFIPLFAIYLCIPVLSLLKENRKILWYMCICSITTQFFAPVILPIVGIGYNGNMAFPLTGGAWVTYAILGYLLHTEEIGKRKRVLLYLSAIGSCIIRYAVTYVLSVKEGATNKLLFSYTNFVALFLAIGVFIFAKYSNIFKYKTEENLKIIKYLASCSLGVYLIHSLIMDIQIKLLNINVASGIWRTIGIVSTYVISVSIITVLKKIPVIKIFVP